MEQIPAGEVERTMKVQEVILRAMAKKMTWWQAAEILGVSPRTMRRWKWGYETHGFRALFDKRKGKPNWEEGADGRGGKSTGALPGRLLRPQRASFSRETEGKARYSLGATAG